MHDIDEPREVFGQAEDAFVADALEVVRLKFVGSEDEFEASPSFAPEFAHQHFDDSEKIVGYKNIKVTVLYSDPTLFLTSTFEYDEKNNDNTKCDDIEYKIKDALPQTQLDAYLSMEKFKQKLNEQNKFVPFGQLIAKLDLKGSDWEQNFSLYKFEKGHNASESQFDQGSKYLERAQALAYWYIDAVSYTANEEERYLNYFLFELRPSDGGGAPVHRFAGYVNLYRFYHHPDMDRVRIAQMLVAPAYRRKGLGPRLLRAIYDNLCRAESVYDITVESPSDAFQYMRDYVDCANCAKLPEFTPEKLRKGFSNEMREESRKTHKLNKTQCRRVYEILRLSHTNMNIPAEKEAFKTELLKRLKRSMMDQKDGSKLSQALRSDQQSLCFALNSLNPDQQSLQLISLYENTMAGYKMVLARLARYEKNFVV
uniref:Histone acetyltransferase type B catalytic subunit n=1 Tax=Globodera rostochiensis TaxID=31243 RepID=A0A914GRG0_GLORO